MEPQQPPAEFLIDLQPSVALPGSAWLCPRGRPGESSTRLPRGTQRGRHVESVKLAAALSKLFEKVPSSAAIRRIGSSRLGCKQPTTTRAATAA